MESAGRMQNVEHISLRMRTGRTGWAALYSYIVPFLTCLTLILMHVLFYRPERRVLSCKVPTSGTRRRDVAVSSTLKQVVPSNTSTSTSLESNESFGGHRDMFGAGHSYLGSLENLQNGLLKGFERGVLNVGVAGGSVSTGSGCKQEKSMWPNRMVTLIAKKTTWTVNLINIAQGATGPQRVFYCGHELLEGEVDLLILEYAINDSGSTWSELLVRSFLPSTAIIFLETFVPGNFGSGSAQMYHDAIARHYDIPILSARDALSLKFRRNLTAQNEFFSDDNHHPSCLGHGFLGTLVGTFISSTFNSLIREQPRHISASNGSYDLDSIPYLSDIPFILETSLKPTCFLASHTLGANAHISWSKASNEKKPTFDCTAPSDGDVTIDVDCSETVRDGSRRDFCQIILMYTKSWQPLGDAALFLGGNETPVKVFHGFNPEWRDKTRITIQQLEGMDDQSLRIPPGTTSLRISCLGSSLAPENVSGFYDRHMFQLHGLLII